MILHVRSNKKLRKTQTKKQLADTKEWLDTINSLTLPSGRKSITRMIPNTKMPKLAIPDARNPGRYPSRGNGIGTATGRLNQSYTGENMVGIGTLHKSNAVPIFNEQEAIDQANMRR